MICDDCMNYVRKLTLSWTTDETPTVPKQALRSAPISASATTPCTSVLVSKSAPAFAPLPHQEETPIGFSDESRPFESGSSSITAADVNGVATKAIDLDKETVTDRIDMDLDYDSGPAGSNFNHSNLLNSSLSKSSLLKSSLERVPTI